MAVREINAFWRGLGHNVNARLDGRMVLMGKGGDQRYSEEIVSDTVDGLPRDFKRTPANMALLARKTEIALRRWKREMRSHWQ